jgi:hypothetical protein
VKPQLTEPSREEAERRASMANDREKDAEIQRLRTENAELREIADALANGEDYLLETGKNSAVYILLLIRRARDWLDAHPDTQ